MVAVGVNPHTQQRALRGQRASPARTRMVWALTVSAAVHLSVVDSLPTGAPRTRARVQALAPVLEAQLVAAGARPAVLEQPRIEAVSDSMESLPVTGAPRTHPGRETLPGHVPSSARAKPVINGPPASDPPRSVPGLVDPVYYSARELDDYPAPAHPLRFGYPAHMTNAGVAGKVVLDVKLDETGVVDQVAVVAAEPPGHFEEHARATLASARFTPGRRDGRAVRSRVTVRVNYDPAVGEGVLR
jgi:protein TonB